MKIFLALVLALHVLAEGLAGVVMVFRPELLLPDLGAEELPYLVSLGFAAISMALVVAWFWPHRREARVVGALLGVLATYHTLQSVGGALLVSMGHGGAGLVTHLPFAVCCWLLWRRRLVLAAI